MSEVFGQFHFPMSSLHLEQMNVKLSGGPGEGGGICQESGTGNMWIRKNIWWTTGEKSIPMRCSRMNCF